MNRPAWVFRSLWLSLLTDVAKICSDERGRVSHSQPGWSTSSHTHTDKNENLKCWKILNRFPNMVMARSNNLGTNNFKEMTPISTTHPPTKLEIINREALHWWPRNPCQKRIGNLKMNINTLISTAQPQVSNSWLSGQRWSLNNAGICSNLGRNRLAVVIWMLGRK